jgi:hypothetical protein
LQDSTPDKNEEPASRVDTTPTMTALLVFAGPRLVSGHRRLNRSNAVMGAFWNEKRLHQRDV